MGLIRISILAMIALGAVSSYAAVPQAAASTTAKAELRDVLLMSISLHQQLILTRMNPDGRCRQYLNQNDAIGFSSVLPTKQQGDDFAPTASPDGKWLAFYSSRSGATNLWLCDSSGKNQRALTSSDTAISDFQPLKDAPIQFSPNSQSIAYIDQNNLWVLGLSGNSPRSLTINHSVEAFRWSKDGKHIIYLSRKSIRQVALSGLPDELLHWDAYNWPSLVIGPDTKKGDIYFFNNGVWHLDGATRKHERVVGSFRFPNRIAINPAGDTVAFVSYSPDVQEEIYLVTPGKKDGGRAAVSLLTQGGGDSPFFSNDGKTVFFTRDSALWSIGTGGEKTTRIYSLPVYLPSSARLEFTSTVECP